MEGLDNEKMPRMRSKIDYYAETCPYCGAVFSSEDGSYFCNPYDIRD